MVLLIEAPCCPSSALMGQVWIRAPPPRPRLHPFPSCVPLARFPSPGLHLLVLGMEVSQRMAVVLSGLRRWPDGEPHGGLRLWPLSCLCPPSPASDCLTPKALPLHKTYIHRKEGPGAPLRDPSNRLTSLLGIRARSHLLGGVTPTSQAEFLQLLPASLFFGLVWWGGPEIMG